MALQIPRYGNRLSAERERLYLAPDRSRRFVQDIPKPFSANITLNALLISLPCEKDSNDHRVDVSVRLVREHAIAEQVPGSRVCAAWTRDDGTILPQDCRSDAIQDFLDGPVNLIPLNTAGRFKFKAINPFFAGNRLITCDGSNGHG
jgi:hypothetical protein